MDCSGTLTLESTATTGVVSYYDGKNRSNTFAAISWDTARGRLQAIHSRPPVQHSPAPLYHSKQAITFGCPVQLAVAVHANGNRKRAIKMEWGFRLPR